MTLRYNIADSELELRFRGITPQLEEVVSLISQFSPEQTPVARKVVLTDEHAENCSNATLVGTEARYTDNSMKIHIGNTSIGIRSSPATTYFHTQRPAILPHILPFLLAELGLHNMCPVHACAVEVNGKGCIVAGPGGSGRTTSILDIVKQGGKFVSDDFSIITDSGHILSTGPLIRLSCEINKEGVMKDHFKLIDLRSLGGTEAVAKCILTRMIHKVVTKAPVRIRELAWKRLSRLSNYAHEVDVRDLWGTEGWIPSISLDRLLFVIVDNHTQNVMRVTPDEIARRVCAVNHLELKRYLELVEVVSFVDPKLGNSLKRSFRRYPYIIRRSIEGAELLIVQGSRDYLPDKIRELVIGSGMSESC